MPWSMPTNSSAELAGGEEHADRDDVPDRHARPRHERERERDQAEAQRGEQQGREASPSPTWMTTKLTPQMTATRVAMSDVAAGHGPR